MGERPLPSLPLNVAPAYLSYLIVAVLHENGRILDKIVVTTLLRLNLKSHFLLHNSAYTDLKFFHSWKKTVNQCSSSKFHKNVFSILLSGNDFDWRQDNDTDMWGLLRKVFSSIFKMMWWKILFLRQTTDLLIRDLS